MRRLRARRKAEGLKPVVKWVPAGKASSLAYSPHRLLEARSLAMHAVIAEKMRREPRVLDTARKNIERWQAKWGRESPPWVAEWRRILRRPPHEIAALITEPTENAARLRQSTPFAGVLTREERRRIYEAFRA